MNILAQYYTRNYFSDLLVSSIECPTPNKILELGAGAGSLIQSAYSRWSQAEFIATDIDSVSVANLVQRFPTINIHQINSLDSDIGRKIQVKLGTVDVAICNPPYLRLKVENRYLNILEDAGLRNCSSLKYITSDLIFLAQNLKLLRQNGQLGIILPDTLLTNQEFKQFRKSLIETHHVAKIIELPEKIFSCTEAQTHILLIEKNGQTPDYLNIYKSDRIGNCTHSVSVRKSDLINRMDYKYHSYFSGVQSQNASEIQHLKLSDLNPIIHRGNLTYKELKSLTNSYIHTTNFPTATENVHFDSKVDDLIKSGYLFAQSGDILLARVGRGCIGKVFMITKGERILSDCVYRIRVAKEFRTMLLNSFQSTTGQSWLKAMAHGVCAKVISKSDLLNFPISLRE